MLCGMRPVPRSIPLLAALASLAAAAPAQATITVNATAPLDFGDQPIFSLGAPKGVTFTTDADTATPVRTINNPDFIVAADGCSGDRLLAGESCTVFLRFSPSARGARPGTVQLVARDASSPVVELKGNGTAPLRGRAGNPGKITCTVKRKTQLGAKLKITCSVKFRFAKKSSSRQARASMTLRRGGHTAARARGPVRDGRARMTMTIQGPGTYHARLTFRGRSYTQTVRVTRAA
jgi:hypothetical protein